MTGQLKTIVDGATKTKFEALAKTRGVSVSQLLGDVVREKVATGAASTKAADPQALAFDTLADQRAATYFQKSLDAMRATVTQLEQTLGKIGPTLASEFRKQNDTIRSLKPDAETIRPIMREVALFKGMLDPALEKLSTKFDAAVEKILLDQTSAATYFGGLRRSDRERWYFGGVGLAVPALLLGLLPASCGPTRWVASAILGEPGRPIPAANVLIGEGDPVAGALVQETIAELRSDPFRQSYGRCMAEAKRTMPASRNLFPCTVHFVRIAPKP